ncbi:unnamed protein product [Durusdinium trenchii]|uniref:WW domain-containing protein n=1 Tax=Durusdinium trenchii TaxID=1381693 RepID=A0ABP0MIL5_9DINO
MPKGGKPRHGEKLIPYLFAVLTEVWVELKTDDGRIYFWNRHDNSRAWSLPEGEEVKWIGEKSPDGRTYYWSRKSKETVWVLPPLEEPKETKEEPPKGALASLLRGEKPGKDSGTKVLLEPASVCLFLQ